MSTPPPVHQLPRSPQGSDMQPSVTRWKTTTAVLLRTTVLSLLAAVAAAGVGVGPAVAADGDVAWTVRTASNSYGAARSSYSYTVNPGGVVEDAHGRRQPWPRAAEPGRVRRRRLHDRRRPARPAPQGQEVRRDRRLGQGRRRQCRDPAREDRSGPVPAQHSRQRHARRLRRRHPHLPDPGRPGRGHQRRPAPRYPDQAAGRR